MPFFCYNKKDYCDHSENCEGCDVWVIGKGGKEVPSNADRIRAMSDEELAKWMAERNVNESTVHLINKYHGLTAVQIKAIRHNVYCGLMQWLKQPAEGDVNNA